MKTYLPLRSAIINFFFCSLLFLGFQVKSVTTYYSINNGNWNANIWSTVGHGGASCSCGMVCNFNQIAFIKHNVTNTCSPTFNISGGGIVTIETGFSFSVTGNLNVSGGSQLIVQSGATLIVNGNVDCSGASTILNSGTAKINGDVSMSGGGGLCGTAAYAINGSISGFNACNPFLPIELITFSGVGSDNKVELSWATATERNNNYFVIERSADLSAFNRIGIVDSKALNGNSQVRLDYTFTDTAPLEGVGYYRLRQVNMDTTTSTSGIISVLFNEENHQKVSVFPNPNRGEFSLNLSQFESNQEATVRLINEKGQEVYASLFYLDTEGPKIFHIVPQSKIPGGVYNCQVSIRGIVHLIKVVVD